MSHLPSIATPDGAHFFAEWSGESLHDDLSNSPPSTFPIQRLDEEFDQMSRIRDRHDERGPKGSAESCAATSNGDGDHRALCQRKEGLHHRAVEGDGTFAGLRCGADTEVESGDRAIDRAESADEGGRIHLSIGCDSHPRDAARSGGTDLPCSDGIGRENPLVVIRLSLCGVPLLRRSSAAGEHADIRSDAGDPETVRARSSRPGHNDGWSGGATCPVSQWERTIDDQLPLCDDQRAWRTISAEGLAKTGDRDQSRRRDRDTRDGAGGSTGTGEFGGGPCARLVAATGERGTRSSMRSAPRQFGGAAGSGSNSGGGRSEKGHVPDRACAGGEAWLGQGAVGGLSPVMGGVAHRGRSGHAHRDMGTAQEDQGDRDLRRVGSTPNASATLLTPTTGIVGRPRKQCQMRDCMAFRQQLQHVISEQKATIKEQEKRIYRFESDMRGEIEGRLRGASEARAAAEDAIETYRSAAKKAQSRVYLLTGSLMESEGRVRKLADEVASLRAELLSFRHAEGVRARREAIEARAQEREQRYEEVLKRRLHAEETRIRTDLQRRAEAAEERAAKAEESAADAREDADRARAEAMAEAEAARQAMEAKDEATKDAVLAARQAARAKDALSRAKERMAELGPRPISRTPEEWAQLKAAALRKARERDVAYLCGVFNTHAFRPADVATALSAAGLLERIIFRTREGFDLYFSSVAKLMVKLEEEHFGEQFGLFLHYELRIPLPLILRIVQAGSKQYFVEHNSHMSKVLLYHPWVADRSIKVPRIAPPRTKLYPIISNLRSVLGVQASEDGRLAFRDIVNVLLELVLRDSGTLAMPALTELTEKRAKVPFVLMLDATGFGSQQLNTIAIRNPLTSASAQKLHYLGLGNCSDDRSGSSKLLGANLARLNQLLVSPQLPVGEAEVELEPYLCMDVAALRHCEHIANSGWCGCSRDFALRQTPSVKPTNYDELMGLLSRCRSFSYEERVVLSHNPLPGKDIPEPCPANGCTFAHNPATARQEYETLVAEERKLAADTSKNGKARFSNWRMKHAHAHSNIAPGEYGRPMFHHHLDQQILDGLHLGALGLPKTPHKHGVLNNASDDARSIISDYLKEIKHPLDTRRKEDNRSRAAKWFTGERWLTFCAGERGSPGGPQAIARIVKIVADDLESRGVDHGGSILAEPPAVERAKGAQQQHQLGNLAGKARSGKAFADRAAASRAVVTVQDQEVASRAQATHVPTQVELAADQDALAKIRTRYGSRAQTLINVLLAFDAYFAWWFPFKCSIPWMAPLPQRVERALDNCRRAIDMHEIFERLCIVSKHGSFLPHGAIFKVSRDILSVGDVWAVGTSPLELQNAETKRVASDVGARNITYLKQSANATTMSISTFTHLLSTQHLRSGEGERCMPDSRRQQRVFGETGSGRLTAHYRPKGEREVAKMSCVQAFAEAMEADNST